MWSGQGRPSKRSSVHWLLPRSSHQWVLGLVLGLLLLVLSSNLLGIPTATRFCLTNMNALPMTTVNSKAEADAIQPQMATVTGKHHKKPLPRYNDTSKLWIRGAMAAGFE
jgi:hypothetical protein